MGIFSIFKRSSKPPVRSDIYPYLNYSRGSISTTQLLENPTVIACVDIIARSVSLLPIHLFHKSQMGRRRAGWHPLYAILKHAPNLEEPSSVFVEKITRDMLMYGNAYVWKSSTANEIDALYSLNAQEVKVSRDSVTHQKLYEYGGKTYTSKQILHIPGAWYDGLKGYSPAVFASRAIEMGVNLDIFASSAFDNGLSARLNIDISEKYPTGAKPDDVRQMADYINRNYAGKDNAGKPLITFDKMKVTPLNVHSNKESELTDARTHQEKIIAQMFHVPLYMIGKETLPTDLESYMVSFLQFTLGPWMRRLEQYFAMLLTPAEQVNYYVEFDHNALLKANLAAKTQSYATLHRIGVLSVNEIRDMENRDPLEDDVAGDTHFIEANLMPLNQETISAYMAGQKLKLQELQGQPKLDKKIL